MATYQGISGYANIQTTIGILRCPVIVIDDISASGFQMMATSGDTIEGSIWAGWTGANNNEKIFSACDSFSIIGVNNQYPVITNGQNSSISNTNINMSFPTRSDYISQNILGVVTQDGTYYKLCVCYATYFFNQQYNAEFATSAPSGSHLGYTLWTWLNSYDGYWSMADNEQVQDILGAAEIVEPGDEETDPYSDIDGEGNIPGGGPVGIPGFPGLTATSTGIIGLFAPSASQMQALADYMWTDFGGSGTDITEVLKEIVEALKRAISNPLDYVIGLNIIPSQGLSIGGSSVIKFGFTSSGVSMPRLSNQYFTVNCGSISFPPLCGDTFLDYAPYSKFSIYLPYIGVKDVDANDFVGHTIGVIYHGDTVTGGVTAYIIKDGSVMYQYSGCCALNIPLSADNWGNTISGAVQIATSLVAAGASGGAAGVGMAAAKGAASVAANPSLLSPQVSHSGAVSGGAGCMAVQYPFVIREAVRFHSTAGFNKFSGYPSYYKRSLGAVSGFTTVLDVHLERVPATNGEIAEIENLLKSGVIL